jgi:hypothetical protein
MQGKYDKRSHKKDLRPEHATGNYLDSLVETAAKFLAPYSKILTVRAAGNHESSIQKNHETDLCERLAERIRSNKGIARRGGYSGFVRFSLYKHKTGGKLSGSQGYKLWYFHGSGGGGPVTRGVIQTNRQAVYVADADFVVTGHCFDDSTEILTPAGWKKHTELSIGEDVMTFNRETQRMEFNKINSVHRYDNYKELIQIKGRSIDLQVTDKHGLWVSPVSSNIKNPVTNATKWHTQTAEEAFGKSLVFKHSGIESNEGIPLNDDQIALLAWIMAEGHIEKCLTIRIVQGDAKDGRLEILERNLTGAVKAFSKNPHKGGKNTKLTMYRYNVLNGAEERKWIFEYLDKSKTPTNLLRRMSNWQRRIFIDTYIIADGSIDKTPNSTGFQLATNRKDHADFLQEICIRSGYRTTTSWGSDGKMIYIHACERECTMVQKHNWSRVPYSGIVWCVSVDNQTLVVRRNGKVTITMNTHDSWQVPIQRIKLNHHDIIEQFRQTHIKIGGYKEEFTDGYGGWHVERGGPPKPTGAYWIRFYKAKSDNGKNIYDYEIIEAK